MAENSALVKMFTPMANFGSSSAKQNLLMEASSCSLAEWRNINRAKTGGTGLATGIWGGPWGVAAEGLDLGYLLRTSARASIGIGHILDKPVEHEEDMYSILAIWSGAAQATNHIVVGKFAVKVGGKLGIQYGVTTAATILAKSALKGNSKLAMKIVSKAAAKLGAKVAAKVGTKWIPIVDGVASAAVNLWVINGLMDAAHKRYTHDYIVFDNSMSS